ncbi:hypothetical protein EWM64_g4432 [Hericium alpestre]|uniref:DUF7729 domain-containing protein n=1 Tax=Hericium alpestre TaxID=135208 RepID=A0A4Z0A065_9AGAM|nr:hypothetical protein EWM64_g4432 [Hericium alpestre]
MKSIAIVSFLATAAYAQSSASGGSSTSTANPLIPTGVSSGCASYLNTLNSDSSLSACTAPLVTASADFAPGSNTTNPSTSTIQSALNNICASSNSCPESTIRGILSDFYSACTPELTSSPNTDLIQTYDTLYSLEPLWQSICAKSDSGAYCVTALDSNATSKRAVPEQTLARRDSAPQYAFIPNAEEYNNKGILFLGLSPSDSSSKLCSSCSRSVLTSYMQFESNVPYGPGLSNSVLLKGQTDLYNAVNSTCGADFLAGPAQAAAPGAGGGLSGGLLSGAPRAVDSKVLMAGTALGALAAAFVAL